ncbi:MAG: hypothetical protein ACLUGI_02580, partial [Subdoligranulum sp.]
MIVVLPEPVEPAMQTDTPYRIRGSQKVKHFSGGTAGVQQFSSLTVCWLTIRMEALTPTSASTM